MSTKWQCFSLTENRLFLPFRPDPLMFDFPEVEINTIVNCRSQAAITCVYTQQGHKPQPHYKHTGTVMSRALSGTDCTMLLYWLLIQAQYKSLQDTPI